MKCGHFTLFRRDKSINKHGVYYYYCYDENGIRIKRSTGERTKAAALEIVLDRIKKEQLLAEKKQCITLAEFAKPYFIYETCPIVRDKIARGEHFSVSHCRTIRQGLDKHVIPFFGDKHLSSITTASIKDWLMELPRIASICNKTANNQFITLRTLLQEAMMKGLLEKNPCDGVKMLVHSKKLRNAFTTRQIGLIFKDEWDNRMAFIACILSATTGMRIGEIRALTTSQMHDDYITVDASWADIEGRKTTKSRKSRCVPICARVRDLLVSIAPESGLIFTLDGEKPVNDRFLTSALYERLSDVGIDRKENRLSFHSFRHFFNTRLVASGVSGEVIRAAIGHESEEMTENYLHLQASDMASIGKVQGEIMHLIS